MTQIEAIAQLPASGKNDSRDYLTLQNIADLCQVSYKMARQYADVDAVKLFTGAYQHPSSKGARYPIGSEPRWRAIFDASAKGLVLPSTVDAWLQNIEVAPAIAQSPASGNDLVYQAVAQLPQQGDEAIALLRQLVNAVTSLAAIPPPDDCLLTFKDAHQKYGLSFPTLRALAVTEGRRRKVRRSDILRRIQQLQTR